MKIRGYRIELGEIEARLREQDSVGETVVVAQDSPTGKQLVAYVVPADAPLANETEFRETLRRALKTHLPDYMVPLHWLWLERLPLNANGKLDRKALPAVDIGQLQREDYLAPRTELEQTLAGIWSEVLGVERVGVNDNFFELGGHSLLATQIASRVQKVLQRNVPLRAMFECSCVAELAGKIFDEREQRFAETSNERLGQLLDPLKERIQSFEKRVEESYQQESRERFSLGKELERLQQLNLRLSDEATNLTRALKGQKTQGNWGELILERVLEHAGLEKGREYQTQVSLKGPDGERFQPDVVITDFNMPGDATYGDGLKLIEYIIRKFPHIQVVVLTMISNNLILSRLHELGVAGVIQKNHLHEEILNALAAVAANRNYQSPAPAPTSVLMNKQEVDERFASLSPREVEVLRIFVAGYSVSEVARLLKRSVKTVSAQKVSAMRKLAVESDQALLTYCIKAGQFQ